jgi:hypothetical protein
MTKETASVDMAEIIPAPAVNYYNLRIFVLFGIRARTVKPTYCALVNL